ncbi:TPA: hypothetical protein DIU27_04820 [Candidatus Collierbacteria bacterium]|uniref:Uncharacterized protein n=1 Tax=Candidatus Collierbacteria bacterium GW2011_GWB2_44_22 TaxID=1618387 RepID=A0A0G1HX47_9BACT|nr:MAG: hypothetical protein UW44_C0014G0005 [Candidatus Collierbacteria bacterium GW2011_GWB2_44_22]KKT65676.1 MAG: hypothetical protein UW58_C0023G0019 [Candidatus Collierbacteria bacterium GW2011_GWC2_44_30]KKT88566.1 MAG: hypothetical protein UW88_C0010G0042 [Candidatus Collierbacteria bacterium GW2011_GWD2_45_10]HCQ31672.1 hypothetical protein [Candidatus Collierbacteria bacterium]
MKIVMPLDKDNVRNRRLTDETDGGSFLKAILGDGRIRFSTNTGMIKARFGFGMPASPLIQASFWAFSQHLPLRLEPGHFWTTIIQEVATMVKLDPERFAALFNGDPNNKKKVIVRCDELFGDDSAWPLAIGRFRSALAVETDTELVEGFFPHFTTDDETHELAYLVSVMDAASPYFDFEVHTLCGIPEIHLDGTHADWLSLYERIEWLEKNFGQNVYFDRIKARVRQIADQVGRNTPDIAMWRSFFKYRQRSGGALANGWLTDFYAYVYGKNGPQFKAEVAGDGRYDGYSLNEFPSGMSVVPFIWQVMDSRYPMRFFAGLTGMEMQNGVLTPLIGYGVIEGEK